MENKNHKETIMAVLFYGIIIAAIYFYFNHKQQNIYQDNITPIPTEDTFTPTNTPAPIIYQSSPVTQYYWYCWDTGNPSPHHLGHHVYGDHLCTNQELGR